MKPLVLSFGRAFVLFFHPRTLAWSLVPLVLLGGALGAAGAFGWESAIDGVRAGLERFDLVARALAWLDEMGWRSLRSMLAPIIVVALAVPVVTIATLALVSAVVSRPLVRFVAERCHPALERRGGAGLLQSIGWMLACTAAALVALVASVPLWLLPPLAVLLPPLVWGWLAYRVLGFDALALHAGADERRSVLRGHRWPLATIGLVTGFAAAVPAALWSAGAVVLVLAPFVIVASVWLYTLVFAFATLWFAAYALAALEAHRSRPASHLEPTLDPAAPAARSLAP